MDYVYIFLNKFFMSLKRWTHKDIFEYEIVWSELTSSGDLKDAEQTYLRRSSDTKIPKTDKVKVRHDTKEKQLSDRQKCLEIAKEKNDKSDIDFWSAMIKKPMRDIWWWKGIRFRNRGILDRVRRYFFLCCHYASHQKNGDASWLSKNWFEICIFFEELETYFYQKLDR